MTSRFSWKSVRLTVAACLVPLIAAGVALALPSYEGVRSAYHPSETLLLDRDGAVLHELRTDLSVRRLAWTPLEATSSALRQAVVRAEDRRFYSHSGVDYRALAAATWDNLFGRKSRGASTISMQLAAILDPSLQAPEGRRSLGQKWRQMQGAWSLERDWSKDRILEAYLNLVVFRGELQGVTAAARLLFEKSAHGLDSREALILAALIRNPNASPADVARRADGLNRALGWPQRAEELAALAGSLSRGVHHSRTSGGLAPHAARRLIRGHAAAAVRTTLDAGIQRFAAECLARHLAGLQAQNVREGALLVVENRTGEIRAYLSLTSDPARGRFVDGVIARRQAGSTLKPFLYALAFDRRILTAASLLEDSPLDLAVASGIYQPQNYDRGFRGTVTARTALASSMNIPAVRALEMVGIESFLEVLRELGFGDVAESGDFYGPSLALGTADITLWELVNAYRTLANDGAWNEMVLTPQSGAAGRPRQVFSPAAAFLVSDILADREARHLTFGLENLLATRFWTAVKTGTSKDMRDNWCVGYSQRYTVGVWIGNFTGESMWDVSGVSGAAPVWFDIMNHLHGSEPSLAGQPPAGVVLLEPPPEDGRQREWFIHGTSPAAGGPMPVNALVRIVYPPAGAVFAIDPDIPLERQRIVFIASDTEGALTWVLDGKPYSADAHARWDPAAGRHIVSLQDPAGRVLDTVVFQVRGSIPADFESGRPARGSGVN
jgi:penicillin-binding protein 1C